MPSMLEVSEMMHPKKGDVKKKREARVSNNDDTHASDMHTEASQSLRADEQHPFLFFRHRHYITPIWYLLML